MKSYCYKLLVLCFSLISFSALAQEIKVASIFGDHMVLQQGIAIPVWGTAQAKQEIKIVFGGKSFETIADENGKWLVKLPKMRANRIPQELNIISKSDTLILKNILIGEVWLASGQSNMQTKLSETNQAAEEIKQANYNQIRLFNVGLNISHQPLTAVAGSWKVCNQTNAGGFSAAAYYFAKDLYQDQNVPVGIISASWGATPVEAWTSGESLIQHPDFKDSVLKYQKLEANWELLYLNYLKEAELAKKATPPAKAPVLPKEKNYPTALFNAMIAPLIPYEIKGVIWYQGENNASRAAQYHSLFPLLIKDWRAKWQKDEMPFLFVQLANFRARNVEPVFADNWALLREAQTATLKVPYTGMAVTIDIGDAKDIHPKNKKDVGKRLYLAAKAIAYGKSITYSGPIYANKTIKNNQVTLNFYHVGKGLTTKGELKAFELAGADKKFYWAKAKIVRNKIILTSDKVAQPVAVRYAWSSNPEANLYNKDGLPAVPFRTDDW
ncbi:sialate O-acetylesterase [Pedobacter puniceum]|uniref:Sialate O-acetylesterase n=1 Tax=Pedobacter puniceum TaxID=2666136 RepID=A0A7K0FLZ6_9SPHI|nr:sialate O-acetylesterase [Pedobacter puniceum]MRX46994.1 sialate O-acetylesterase [Pedobacter puniceum]